VIFLLTLGLGVLQVQTAEDSIMINQRKIGREHAETGPMFWKDEIQGYRKENKDGKVGSTRATEESRGKTRICRDSVTGVCHVVVGLIVESGYRNRRLRESGKSHGTECGSGRCHSGRHERNGDGCHGRHHGYRDRGDQSHDNSSLWRSWNSRISSSRALLCCG